MFFKVNELLSLELPEGYEATWETDNKGEPQVVIRAGMYIDNDGEIAYEFVMNGDFLEFKGAENDVIASRESLIDTIARKYAGNNMLFNLSRNAVIIIRKAPLNLLGTFLKHYGIMMVYHLTGNSVFVLTRSTIVSDDPEENRILYKHLLTVSNSVRLNGQKADFGNIDVDEFMEKLLPVFEDEENTVGNIGLKITVNGKEIDLDDEDYLHPVYIDEELHEHYTIVESGCYTTHADAEFVAQPIRMLMNQEGNQDTEEYLCIDNAEECDDYDEDKKAIELAKVFRLNKDLFDPYCDTEAMIRRGMFAKVRMLHALRSLAWTAMRKIDEEDEPRNLEDLAFDELLEIGEYIKEHDYLNYGACPFSGLCAHPDWHVFYVPGNYNFDSDLQYLCGKQNRGGNTVSFHLPEMGDSSDTHHINELISRNEEEWVDLEDLRAALIELEPVMQTIHDGFMVNRDRSQPLEGPLADALIAWCALCVAAREPFYSEEAADTPEANAGLKEALKRPTDALPNGERDEEGVAPAAKKESMPAGELLDVGGKKVIEPRQFQANMTLRNIVIPEGVEEIGESAFEYCMSLETVVFPKSLRKIDQFAFMGCRSLKKVELQEGIRILEDSVFSSCSSLLRVDLPDSLEKVSWTVFGLGGNNPYSTAYLSGETAKRLMRVDARRLVIDGQGYDSIQQYLGTDSSMRYVPDRTPEQKIAQWMEMYGKYVTDNPQIQFAGKLFVFSGFGGNLELDHPLVQAVLAKGGKYRKGVSARIDYLVVDPEKSDDAKPQNAVREIVMGGKTKIVLKKDIEAALSGEQHTPATVTQQPEAEVETSCRQSEQQEEKPTQIAPVLADPDDCEIDIFGCLMKYHGCEPHLILPDGLRTIGDGAVFANKTLQSIVIPEGVETIEKDAFELCERLAQVTLPESIRRIGEGAFKFCWGLCDVFIHDGCEEIGEDAFSCCAGLETIYVPDSVSKIGKDAFSTNRSYLVIHTVQGSAADEYAKENKVPVKYDYEEYARQRHAKPGNVKKPVAAPEKGMDVSADDQATLDEIAAIGASWRQEGQTPDKSRQARNTSSVENSRTSRTAAVDPVDTDLYIILNNENMLGMLNRRDEEFYECYAEDFPSCGKMELLRKRRQILNDSKGGFAIPKQHIDAFKARSVADRFSVSTSNLFNMDNSEINFDKKAEKDIARTKDFYTAGELEEVRRLMDQKLKDTRSEIDGQYDAIEPSWKRYRGARNHIKVYLVDPDTPEREADCVFQKEQDNALVMIKMAKPGMSFMVVRLINCMAWYWNVTPQQIWEQALKNGVEDQRSRTTRNASDIAQKAFYKQFPEVAAAVEREKAAQQRAKKEAEEKERRARIRKLEGEIRDLENERDNLRGLFMGGKRKKLQAQIDALQRELDFLKR